MQMAAALGPVEQQPGQPLGALASEVDQAWGRAGCRLQPVSSSGCLDCWAVLSAEQ